MYLLCLLTLFHAVSKDPLTDPRCKVIRSLFGLVQQVDMPTHCSSGKYAIYVLVWFCHTCNALWVLSQVVILLAVHQPFVRAASFVLQPTLFITSFVSLIRIIHNLTLYFAYGVFIQHTNLCYKKHTFSKAAHSSFYFITLHFVIHSLQ